MNQFTNIRFLVRKCSSDMEKQFSIIIVFKHELQLAQKHGNLIVILYRIDFSLILIHFVVGQHNLTIRWYNKSLPSYRAFELFVILKHFYEIQWHVFVLRNRFEDIAFPLLLECYFSRNNVFWFENMACKVESHINPDLS